MKTLVRPLLPASLQKCLNQYQSRGQSWDDFTRNAAGEKEQLREQLCSMQGGECAYCGSLISSTSSHIEHFTPRSRDPRQTFLWPNLFLSCDAQKHCGRWKDSRSNPLHRGDTAQLLKPDQDRPSDIYDYSPDGSVIIVSTDTKTIARAEYTRDRLGLNEPRLKGQRENLIRSTQYLSGFPDETVREVVGEIKKSSGFSALLDRLLDHAFFGKLQTI